MFGLQGFLAALQLSDSALPIGRFVHSAGLEAFLTQDGTLGEPEISELLQSWLMQTVGPLDGVAVAAAHRAASEHDLQALGSLDRVVTCHKLTPPSRLASTSCGRSLAALGVLLTADDTVLGFCAGIAAGRSDGNLAVVEGAIAWAMHMSAEQAVLVELRGAAWTMISAAVRLGRVTATRGQALLGSCQPVLLAAAAEALRLPTPAMRSTLPELEVYALRHRSAETRSFMT